MNIWTQDVELEVLPLLESEIPFPEEGGGGEGGGGGISVRGRLRKSLKFWKVRLQVTPASISSPFVAKNDKSATQEFAFVESAINELLSLECISEVYAPPEVINPLSVYIQKSERNAWFWISVTLISTSLGTSLDAKMFSVAREVLSPGDCMFSFDLKSSYHHVEVFPYHRQYLPFSWTFSFGFIRYFQFEVSLFGLSSAPYLSLYIALYIYI